MGRRGAALVGAAGGCRGGFDKALLPLTEPLVKARFFRVFHGPGAGMTERTTTRADLAEAVYQEVGLSRSESAALVDALLDEVATSLLAEGAVKISAFGSFVVRWKGERLGRNPKTGEEVPISPRRVLVFRPSQVLKDRLNACHAESAS